MALVSVPAMQFVDAAGHPLVAAALYFYQTGTTNPVTVWSNAALSNPIAQPVLSDGNGIFPAIYITGGTLYRMKLVVAGGSLMAPLLDIDPIGDNTSITAAQIANGAIEAKLGYTPVNPAAAVFTAPARLTIAGALLLHADDIGYMGAPVVVKDINYTFTLDDSGRFLIHDDASTPVYTIPPNAAVAFPLGHKISVFSPGAGNLTIARGAAVSLIESGDVTGVNSDKVLSQWTFVTIQQYALDAWVIERRGIDPTSLQSAWTKGSWATVASFIIPLAGATAWRLTLSEITVNTSNVGLQLVVQDAGVDLAANRWAAWRHSSSGNNGPGGNAVVALSATNYSSTETQGHCTLDITVDVTNKICSMTWNEVHLQSGATDVDVSHGGLRAITATRVSGIKISISAGVFSGIWRLEALPS